MIGAFLIQAGKTLFTHAMGNKALYLFINPLVALNGWNFTAFDTLEQRHRLAPIGNSIGFWVLLWA
jgi:hypothetical protein